MVDVLPGVIAGRYKILREIGRGGMGVVYAAEQVKTGERVALKVMNVDDDDTSLLARFQREARFAAKIASEHVVRILDADIAPELDGRPFLVMDLLQGKDLDAMVLERGPLPAREVVELLSEAARGIERAHAAGIVHRDLKPSNLFVHTTPEGRRIVKVLDFGVARILDPDATIVTKTGAIVGSPRTMAPEQVMGDAKAISPQTDVWAVGLIAFELLTGGMMYWTSDNAPDLLREITRSAMHPPSERAKREGRSLPIGFDTWFMRSCARDPRARFSSVREQVDALAEVVMHARGLPAGAPEPSSTPRSRPVSKKLALAIGSGVGLLAGIAIVVTVGTSRPSNAAIPVEPAPPTIPVPSPSPSPSTFASPSPPLETVSIPPVVTAPPKPRPPSRPPSEPLDVGEPGFLTVSSYPWARVSEGGRTLCSATPCAKIPLSPGPHTLAFENREQNLRQTVIVEIKSGETTTKNIALH